MIQRKKTAAEGTQLRGAIFDLDGTVLDSMPCWETVGTRYLQERGIAIPDPEDLARRLKTTTLPQAAELYQTEFGIPKSVEAICADIVEMIGRDYRERAPLKPHVEPVLRRLQREGVVMCIATATDAALADAALMRLGVRDCFAFISTCQQLNTSKRETLIFDDAVARMGVDKQDTVVFEDSLHSIETAAKAGYRVIGVYDNSARAEVAAIAPLCERFVFDWDEY